MTDRLAALALLGDRWTSGLAGSAPSRLLRALGTRWHRSIAPWVADSAVARWLPAMLTASLCVLLAVSPFVSAGANALMVVLTAGLSTLTVLLRPDRLPRLDGLLLPVLAYVAVSAVAVGFSSYPVLAAKGLAKTGIFMLAYVGFYLGMSPAGRRWPLVALMAGASAIALHGIYQWTIRVPPLALWDDAGSLGHITRVYSFRRNPNLLAGYLLPTMALTGAITMGERGRWRWIGMGSTLAQATCLYFTYSRGGWIGAMAVFGILGAVWLWRYRDVIAPYRRRLVGAVVALGAVAVMVVLRSPALMERLASMVTVRGHSSNSFRANVWAAVVRMIQDTWICGIGPGNDVFKKIYPLYMTSGFEALGAYNIYLEVFVELGIAGMIVFVWLLGSHVARQIWGMRQSEGTAMWLSAGCLAGLAGIMVHGLVDTVFYRPQVSITFWLLLALTARLRESEAPA